MNENLLFSSELFSKGYGFMPKLVAKDSDLSIEAKAIYSYLASYSGAGLSSFPSTSLILHDLGISENRYLKHRKTLVDKGYLTIKRERLDNGFSKNIYIINQNPSEVVHLNSVHLQNVGVGNVGIQNEGTISNSFKSNNINSNSNNKKTMSSSDEQDDVPYKEIVEYLNLKTSKKYKHSTNKTKSLIKARWNEGFRVDDFKKVIDNKCFEWIGNPDMAKYLRPETLFGNKFEGYLNENNVIPQSQEEKDYGWE
ncbi:conserved phage C-terminal domain-containing protein [Vagococcus carniphilus]|uniref:conserved phage C-terminal domain-containing protein n=1 Tax=Vagococcus carniphilus TaxID=218144 RepID=UPI00288E0BB0|nr:conserved phage C-terminal domain-containing protein [Vagococcus carniphilus]MDT2832283.1 conserved phage C-terminal domain-containing protein [Vagococcus carniphilus]MDT2840722.1 conserved phage C-terminal domain-containing protein [Vagococcus carniphilus]MDT2855666.1 conserved phage C-terminal domain-containing protein [Vagococcus carniphilus]